MGLGKDKAGHPWIPKGFGMISTDLAPAKAVVLIAGTVIANDITIVTVSAGDIEGLIVDIVRLWESL